MCRENAEVDIKTFSTFDFVTSGGWYSTLLVSWRIKNSRREKSNFVPKNAKILSFVLGDVQLA